MAWKAGFAELTKKTHSQQGVWWLNGFWEKGAEKEANTIYEFVQTFKELDHGGKIIELKGKAKEKQNEYKEGCDLDEFKAHRFLETVGETLTVVELRKRLETIDIDKNKRMAISEYLLFRYKQTPDALVNSPQGDNQKEIAAAQEQVAQLQAALTDLQQKLDEQKALVEKLKVEEEALAKLQEEQTAAEEAAKKALADQETAEALVKKAEAELKAAVDDLVRQETEYKTKVDTLKGKTEDSSLSTVQKSKAVAELAQLQSEDPLPLRKAKITQEAALRKVEKERKVAEKATDVAKGKAQGAEEARKATDAKKAETEESRKEAEIQKEQVEKATKETEEKFSAAQATLDELKKKSGAAHGALWWIEKDLAEAKKFFGGRKK